ncbi:hypothetical protein KFL_000070615 [Klebsormidium nitens]|uniref:Uncharacterized protein n=1 Tax=Klebsormidium nitens TaxID=105231 RepID=A0A1Y1HI05_KLENI|nr:hypothetical protein KFL_000070615 [Klebsormidium nitens]|eukprot:GAQ78094.1 hypothetical protein KFL_000070615 [Klebsormidium nitens]
MCGALFTAFEDESELIQPFLWEGDLKPSNASTAWGGYLELEPARQEPERLTPDSLSHTSMAMVPRTTCARVLILVTLFGCRLISVAHSLTIEQIDSLVEGPLWNQTSIFLSSRGLSGPLPPELGSLTNLTHLFLYSNNLSGPIPPEPGNMTSLAYLELQNNSLSGPIPPELGRLTRLIELVLQDNNLSGPIPPEFGSLDQISLPEQQQPLGPHPPRARQPDQS